MIQTSDTVIIKCKSKNRGRWCLRKISMMLKDNDDVTRANDLKIINSTLQRAVKQLHPLKLNYDAASNNDNNGKDISDHQSSARNASSII